MVTTADGARTFVKAATDDATADWLRIEKRVYDALHGASFLAQVVRWSDPGGSTLPMLVLEDLSEAHWPPPWRPGDVERVLEAISRVHASTIPDLPVAGGETLSGWDDVSRDPQPFLAIGLASRAWLNEALPALLEASARAPVAGDALLHQDLRSDNLCLTAERVVILDWNWVCRGNPDLDLAFWLPSLESEGGPPPERVLPNAPELAARVAGFFAARAGLPPLPQAPHVRDVQLSQLRTALPWAARSLGLPPLSDR